MPLTNFPNGIFASPVVGADHFAGMWRGRVWFVDGTNGLNGNPGTDPTLAVQTLARAIALASKDDTIYIRPQAVGVRYTENVTVPVSTHAGLSIIGTGNGHGNSVYQACSFKGVTSVDAPVMILNSSYANVENIHFYSNAAPTTNGFGVLMRWNTPVGLALNIGSAIVNCSFTTNPDSPPAAGNAQAAIRMDSTEGQLVQGCFFEDCRVGISVGSTQSAAYSIKILNNNFGGLAANIAADIYMTDVNIVDINDNTFNHAVPTHAAGSLTKYIYVAGTSTGCMGRNYQAASDVAKGTNNTLSNILASGNFGAGGPWTS